MQNLNGVAIGKDVCQNEYMTAKPHNAVKNVAGGCRMQYVIWALLAVFCACPVVVAQVIARKEEQGPKGGDGK